MRFKFLQSIDPQDAVQEAQTAYGSGAILHEHEGRFFALIAARTAVDDEASSFDGPDDLAGDGPNDAFSGAPTRTLDGIMRQHRIPPVLAERLEGASDGIGECETALMVSLGKVLSFGPTPRRVLVIGAPGSGKTTLIAKLASRPRREPVKIGWMPGVDPNSLIAYASALGLEVEPLADSAVEPSEIALVEAPGTLGAALRHGDTTGLEEALELARAAYLTPLLVLPAESGIDEAVDLAAAAEAIGIEHLAISRLDQAKHMGAVLAAAALSGLQLTTASINPHMAYGLRALTPAVLARLMLEEKGSGLRLHETGGRGQTARAYLQSVY